MAVSYTDRTVLITGAAGGLGRACAAVMASRGANLVLVDLADATPLAEEIVASGGRAVALATDMNDPDAPQACIRRALDTFGRIDALVAAAGMLKDRSFARMDLETEFAPVLRVHLEAPFRLAHVAWPHFQEAGYGRILFFSSHAGLFGNYGQANYGTAKMALVGLTRTLAIEGARHNIHVNAIAPLAATDMAAATMLADHGDVLQASDVAAAAAWLCSEQCDASGMALAVAGAALAAVRIVQSSATQVSEPGSATPEIIASCWSEICGMQVGDVHGSALDAATALLTSLRDGTSGQRSQEQPERKS